MSCDETVNVSVKAGVNGAPDHQLNPTGRGVGVECPPTLAPFDLTEDPLVDLLRKRVPVSERVPSARVNRKRTRPPA